MSTKTDVLPTCHADDICYWHWDEEDATWYTDCGESFVLDNDDSPHDNRMYFCCYCGKHTGLVYSCP